jgi:hypothetical protein
VANRVNGSSATVGFYIRLDAPLRASSPHLARCRNDVQLRAARSTITIGQRHCITYDVADDVRGALTGRNESLNAFPNVRTCAVPQSPRDRTAFFIHLGIIS